MSNKFNNAPPELRAHKIWVCWRAERRGEKITKIPVTPSGAAASVRDPATWFTFEACVAASHRFSGVGFVLVKEHGFVAIDGDGASDPAMLTAHMKVFGATTSYAETSPSGKGFHILLRGNLPGPGRRRHGVEIYDDARFMTFTGDVIAGRTKIVAAQEFINQLYQELGGPNGTENPSPENREQTQSDADICERLRRGANGAIFDQLFTGSWQQPRGIDGNQKYPSASEADQALANLIGNETGNYDQFCRLFLASSLARDSARGDKYAKPTRADYLLRRLFVKGRDRITAGENARKAYQPRIETLIAAWQEKRVQPRLNGVQTSLAPPGAELQIIRGEDVVAKPIRWLWRNWLAKQKMHVLYGSPEAGKSTLLLSLASILSRGELWPDETRAPVGNVLIWSSEDNIDDTLKPRLVQMGFDGVRVRFIGGVRDKSTGKQRAFKPSTDMPLLIAALNFLAAEGWRPDMIVIDPLVAIQAGKGDQNSNVDTRAALDVLTELSVTHDCAVIGIHHASKGSQGRNLVERATGSLAIGAVARLMLYAIANPKHDDDPDEPPRILGRAKGNIGKPALPVGYTIKDGPVPMPDGYEIGCVEWLGQVEGTMQEIVDEAEKKPTDANKHNKVEAALEWLRATLVMPMRATEIYDRAKADGISERTLRRASDGLINKHPDSNHESWWEAKPELWSQKSTHKYK